MKKFSELGVEISDEKKIFDCKQVSITEIVNCTIVIFDYILDVKTRHGEGRCLVRFEYNSVQGKFFTNSKNIKSTLDAIDKNDFPFETTIKCVRLGQNSLYKLT